MSQPPSSAALRSLLSLTEKREKLLGELSAIESQISSVLSGTTAGSAKSSRRAGGLGESPRSAKPFKREGKRGKRGALKELILEALKGAGTKGISVRELSAKLGVKNQNVYVWFATTGKKLTEKAEPGVYRLKKSAGEIEKPVVSEKPVKAKTAKKGKKKPSAPKVKLAGEQ